MTLAERAWFSASLIIGRALRSSRYSTVRVVGVPGATEVRKRRLLHAPLLIGLAGPLVRALDTGVVVLQRQAWEARERQLYDELYATPTPVQSAGPIVRLPWLPGRTLATLLEDPGLDASTRATAMTLAAVALARFHARGFTHGDAMAENVLVDLDGARARWFDFETLHDPRRSIAWRRADDLRALLTTCSVRCGLDTHTATVALILDAYGDEDVTRELAAQMGSVWRRALPFHLAQAPMSRETFRAIGRALRARLDTKDAGT